jgi:hypothetical protein
MDSIDKSEIKAEAKRQRREARAAKAEQREAQRQERRRLKQEQQAKIEASFGRLVIRETCAGKTVEIYDKGYVRVSGALFGNSAPFEKLKAISGNADVTKKSALGRTLAAGATLGANLVYSPNKRGDLYLTIATETKVHSVHMSPPTERDMKAMHKLATSGQAVIDSVTAAVEAPTTVPKVNSMLPQDPSIADELKKLAELRDSGALTEDEFFAAKKKLLS